jgi:hypothetical protein
MRVMERTLFPSTIALTICTRFSVLSRFMDTVCMTAQAASITIFDLDSKGVLRQAHLLNESVVHILRLMM